MQLLPLLPQFTDMVAVAVTAVVAAVTQAVAEALPQHIRKRASSAKPSGGSGSVGGDGAQGVAIIYF